MKFKVTISEEDYLAYQMYVAFTNPRILKKSNNGRYITTILFAVLALFFYQDNKQFLAIYFFVFSVVAGIYYQRYFKWRYKKHYQKHIKEIHQNNFNKVSEVELNAHGIYTKDHSGESRINLSEIEKGVETENYIFLKISSGSALILPKREIENLETLKSTIINLGLKLETNF